MPDIEKEEKRLYIYAMYYHLIHKGYPMYKAEFLVKRVLRDKSKDI